MQTIYIESKEVAKYIRNDLKKNFPGVKFSVKSDYNSVRVSWTDGPAAKQVDAIIKKYAGGSFDSMIDLSYNHYHWMLPDGSLEFASTAGTAGSGGTVEAVRTDKPHPEAKRVSLMSHYIFSDRHESIDLILAAASHLGILVEVDGRGDIHAATQDAEMLVYRTARQTSAWKGA